LIFGQVAFGIEGGVFANVAFGDQDFQCRPAIRARGFLQVDKRDNRGQNPENDRTDQKDTSGAKG
jgi:hypothetical protein